MRRRKAYEPMVEGLESLTLLSGGAVRPLATPPFVHTRGDTSRPDGTILVTARLNDRDGTAAVDARAVLLDGDGNVLKETTLDGKGKLTWRGLPAGTYKVAVIYHKPRVGNFFGIEKAVFRSNRDRWTPSITLQKVRGAGFAYATDGDGYLRVTIKDGSKVVEGATVVVTDRDGTPVAGYVTNHLGIAVFEYLRPGYYRISARAGHREAIDSVVLVDRPRYRVTPTVQLWAAGTIPPGIYVASRQAAGLTGTAHQFVLIVPRNPASFAGVKDLGHGVKGITLAGNQVSVIGGELLASTNNPGDIRVLRKFLRPAQYPDGQEIGAIARVELGRADVDATARALIEASRRYVSYERAHPLPYSYPLLGPGKYNSNSWAQSLVEYIVGPGRVQENFPGYDALSENRIPRAYFVG